MTILFLSLPITPLLSSAAFAFTWVTRNGQFDDLEMPALRFLELDQV
jgi:cbb3-type cytochrome oxidase maturation protein